ncbi:hypothetical protein HAX54_008544, partial [Datura stramonium]|nr:hypothetical protein [Datura stramonium]
RLVDSNCWAVNVVIGHVIPCICLLVVCGLEDRNSIIPTRHVLLITIVGMLFYVKPHRFCLAMVSLVARSADQGVLDQ